jgi:hypothetical protein
MKFSFFPPSPHLARFEDFTMVDFYPSLRFAFSSPRSKSVAKKMNKSMKHRLLNNIHSGLGIVSRKPMVADDTPPQQCDAFGY